MDATNKYAEISDLISLKAPSKDKLSRAIEGTETVAFRDVRRLTAFTASRPSELDAILNN